MFPRCPCSTLKVILAILSLPPTGVPTLNFDAPKVFAPVSLKESVSVLNLLAPFPASILLQSTASPPHVISKLKPVIVFCPPSKQKLKDCSPRSDAFLLVRFVILSAQLLFEKYAFTEAAAWVFWAV